ncbi:MAG: efflux RND transporter periplasmic adaptor subunit [Gammaproteobacteria bacterium]|nr:efflux RND transporter periplasmic adaptor subunit [Gammaproteobacteria bacterium]
MSYDNRPIPDAIPQAHDRLPTSRMLYVVCVMLAWSAAVFADAVPVVVDVSSEQPVVERVPVSGTVYSPRVARLSPEVAGRVSDVLADAGHRATAGAPLLHLDSALAELDREAAQAATAQAREELADARRRLRDAERLVKSRVVAETDVEDLRSEVRADQANLNLRLAEQRREEERLRRHTLQAPFAGVISRKSTESGEWVTPGDVVFELVADDGLRIDFPVPQAYFPRVGTGTPVDIRLDALPGRRIGATVTHVIPVSDPSARTFLVRVGLDAAGLPLTPGMSASGELKLESGIGVVVPRDALLRHPDGRVTVWIIEQDDRVSEHLVETGPSFDGRVVIRQGLAKDTRIVVEGNEALRPGQQVKVREVR